MSCAVIMKRKGKRMKIKFLRNCEYNIEKSELFGGYEETPFTFDEVHEVSDIRSIDADPQGVAVDFSNGWHAPYMIREDFEIVN